MVDAQQATWRRGIGVVVALCLLVALEGGEFLRSDGLGLNGTQRQPILSDARLVERG